MFRQALWSLAVGTVLFLASVMPAIAAENETTLAKLATTATEVHDRLARKITADGFEPNTPLRDALGHYGQVYGLTILVDTEAFKEELQINEPEQQPVRLPRMVNVPLRTVLQLTVEQAQATAVQTGTIVWVLPKERALARVLQQEVDVVFERRPLDQALNELSRQTGFSIVLDEARCSDQTPAAVTARLRGVGLENAVRIVADAAGLKAVLVGRVLYVTTPEHAEELRQEQSQRDKAKPKAKHELKGAGA